MPAAIQPMLSSTRPHHAIAAENPVDQQRAHALEDVGGGQNGGHRLQPVGQDRERIVDAAEGRQREDEEPG